MTTTLFKQLNRTLLTTQARQILPVCVYNKHKVTIYGDVIAKIKEELFRELPNN
jgi:hypothetical protein